MEIARGGIGDRPWGATLFAAARANISCHVCVTSGGATHELAFEGDAVVSAKSSLVADSAIRIALMHRLISPSQIAAITRRIECDITRDEVDVIAECARFDSTLVAKFRQRVIAQRAARTFALDDGTFTIQMQADGQRLAAVDVRWIIHNGVRSYCSENRLSRDVEMFGSRFTLRPEALDTLSQYGFDASDRPILEALRSGTTLYDLEAAHPHLDPRAMHAAVYALVVCGACEAQHRSADPMLQRGVRAARPDTEPCEFDPDLMRIPLRRPEPTSPTRFARSSTPRLGRGSQPPPTPAASNPADDEPFSRSPDELATEAFRRGLSFLKEDRVEHAIDALLMAVELAPRDPDHHAMLAWARFCGAADRSAAAVHARRALAHAIQKSTRPMLARFYLGRVERMLGRDQEAFEHFQIVLDEQPWHTDALAEVRVLAARRR